MLACQSHPQYRISLSSLVSCSLPGFAVPNSFSKVKRACLYKPQGAINQTDNISTPTLVVQITNGHAHVNAYGFQLVLYNYPRLLGKKEPNVAIFNKLLAEGKGEIQSTQLGYPRVLNSHKT